MNKTNKSEKRPRKKKIVITDKQGLAWLMSLSGKKQVEISKKLGVGQATISRWNGQINEFIKSCPEYQQVAPRLAKMIPKALDCYDFHLGNPGSLKGNPDVMVSNNVFKMIGVLIDTQRIEDNRSELSDDELWQRIRNRLNRSRSE